MWAFFVAWLRSLFFARHLDVCIVGLPGAGKTTLACMLTTGDAPKEVEPTVGYNMRQVRAGNAELRLWDIGYVC